MLNLWLDLCRIPHDAQQQAAAVQQQPCRAAATTAAAATAALLRRSVKMGLFEQRTRLQVHPENGFWPRPLSDIYGDGYVLRMAYLRMATRHRAGSTR